MERHVDAKYAATEPLAEGVCAPDGRRVRFRWKTCARRSPSTASPGLAWITRKEAHRPLDGSPSPPVSS